MHSQKLSYIVISLVTVIAIRGTVAADSVASSVVVGYARPLSFEPNQGQIGKQVDFLARGSGYSIFLSRANAVFLLRGSVPKPGSRVSESAVRMVPVGAAASSPDALGEQAGKSNYFIGSVPERWHTNIPNYAKVRYRNIYPGIDLIYYGNQRQLEYDFVLAPGADPRAILLEFQGTTRPTLDSSGDIVMHTAAGDLHWHKPVAYQQINTRRRLVACAYRLKGAYRLAFSLATYDRTQPVIIDPVLEYSTYLGGSDIDSGGAIAVDSSGNAYVTGSTTSPDFPVKNAFQRSYAASFGCCTPNAFVTKFDPTGGLVYSTYLGGSGNASTTVGDGGNGIAVDSHGNAYVTGFTASGDFPTKNPFQATNGDHCNAPPNCYGSNGFVTKLNAAGNALFYSTFLGGTGTTVIEPHDFGNGIAVDAQGNAYVTGHTDSDDFPIKHAFQATPGGIFVTKFDAAGTALVYSTFLGVGGDSGNGIAVDSNRNAYVTGHTDDPDFPTRNAFQEKRRSYNGDAFVTKFDPAGTALVYSTYLGGGGADTGNAIAVDSQEHAYVTGVTTSTDFPLKNAFQRKLKSSGGNAFVTKFHSDGVSLFYSTYLGGSGSDSGNSITVDSGSHPYITGVTTSSDFPTSEAFQPKLGSSHGNAFVTKFHYDGASLFYSSYLGGSGGDIGNGIAVDTSGSAYVTGRTSSSDFPTKNAFQPMLGAPGAQNAFVTKISAQ